MPVTTSNNRISGMNGNGRNGKDVKVTFGDQVPLQRKPTPRSGFRGFLARWLNPFQLYGDNWDGTPGEATMGNNSAVYTGEPHYSSSLPSSPLQGGPLKFNYGYNPAGSAADDKEDEKGYPPPPPGTYDVYRRMTACPTLALAKAIVVSPILAGNWSFEVRDETSEDTREWIQEHVEPLRQQWLRDALRCLEFGWQGFEKVWRNTDDGLRMLTLKPLLPEFTKILVDKYGNYTGLTNRPRGPESEKYELDQSESWCCTYDAEAGNLYGRSRHENARELWAQWEEVSAKEGIFLRKVAGAVPIIHYPMGMTEDQGGAARTNYEMARLIGQSLGNARPIYMPNLFASVSGNPSEIDVRDLEPMAKLAGESQWKIDFIDGTGNAGVAPAFTERQRYLDSLLMRAWLRPERSAIEGQNGTKAEAESHADVGMLDSELVHQEIVEQLNKGIIDDILVANWGESARGSVYITPSPLMDDRREIDLLLLKAAIANPAIFELVLPTINWNATWDRLGITKADETIDLVGPLEEMQDQRQENRDQNQAIQAEAAAAA